MPLFDAYVFIDWSAASGVQPQQPIADAVWVGELIPRLNYQQETYHRTRNGGVAHVTSALVDQVKESVAYWLGLTFHTATPLVSVGQ